MTSNREGRLGAIGFTSQTLSKSTPKKTQAKRTIRKSKSL
jgi:hypothetical protein